MLYWLFYEQLFPLVTPFRIFGYVTFRTLAASLCALLISIVLGPWLIRKLRHLQIGQHIREDGPQSHLKKQGTPTMGGLLIIIAVLIPTLLFANLRNLYVWVALGGMLGYGAIGLIDDLAKVRRARNLGLTGRQKMALQVVLVLVLGGCLLVMREMGLYTTEMNVPFFKNWRPDLLVDSWMTNPWTYPFGAIFFLGFLWLVVVGSSNAVNLTDGLDGLATGLMIIAGGAMTVLCYVSGHAQFASYLDIARLSGAAELTIFASSLTGACLGFLWYNAHPAEVFMGDVGSLALGGSLGVLAVLIKQEILLIFIGGVYVIEALSVMIQVASFKLTGRRVFLMAPIHHHFEKLGWEESKVIARFWIAGLVMALFALTTLKLR
ncbi:MAG: phospho-N-acetylmuramoyl-pentapeptide-transferase [Bryobacteraceae bacterium]|nr:phospho-N-acetylmuramoyl-pentapeptide-transferase [Solibacteraceae bacterium]MCO5351433.1 phospho-N-acetylmuramoyl-pentapeptide-transferase [Bryobacteraceae bacterium]